MADRHLPQSSTQFHHTIVLQLEDGHWIIESHCPICGAFIGASPNLQMILIAERCHRCSRRREERRRP